MDAELARQAEILFGQDAAATPADAEPAATTPSELDAPAAADPIAPDAAVPKSLGDLTSTQTRRLWRHVERIENFWETLEEIEPGSIARLAALAATHRWEIIFLTKRPHTVGMTAQLQSQRWLVARGFPLPSVFVVQRSRGAIAASLALDIVVDDRPENCLDVVVDSKARPILVWRPGRELLPSAANRLGIGVVTSVAQCLDLLEQLEAPEPRRASIFDRVMRTLGLKEEPAAKAQ